MPAQSYIGRFAPSPSGPLHLGSLVTAMASYLDAKVHKGRWLLRIEDIDEPRTVSGADFIIMQQLSQLGLQWDLEPVWQTRRKHLYQQAFNYLQQQQMVYGCACRRKSLAQGPYPGTCRLHPPPATEIRSWRFKAAQHTEIFNDHWYGTQTQNVSQYCGDFVIRRADGLWAYQLAVVVDDAKQGINHVVRGADLLSSTARQIQLARALNLPIPEYMHIPLVLDINGHKLSKQNHAAAIDTKQPLISLQQAWQILGLQAIKAKTLTGFWQQAMQTWAAIFLKK